MRKLLVLRGPAWIVFWCGSVSGYLDRTIVRCRFELAVDAGITDSACKNQLVMVNVQYGPFNPYIPIRSTTIGKSRVAKDPIAMHTSWRSNSDIVSVTSRKLQWIQSQRKDFQTQCLFIQTQEDKSIIVEEDSGEAIDEPDASNSSIQSKSLYESAVATQPVASFASSRKENKAQRYPVVVMDQQRSS
ncbi:hypothetical protein F511_24762 [Dorcoceras hygrometricum]|uniref:Uncharacterized protein n=1 Tax=Dorcoceras hygrometricum TaxID=472368 RepID=A0A2Z7B723_9LAMI|nr:hypothetical protein F511_24762 [Dorcoceras hygrometricum]